MRLTRRALAQGALTAAAQQPPAIPDASAATAAAQAAQALPPFADTADFARARRGFVAALPEPVRIVGAEGRPAWDLTGYGFLPATEGNDAPPTVHPALWRMAKLNAIHGLFEVADGIWQVRGYDLSVMTVIRGRTGWIVLDPLRSAECSRAAWQGLVLPKLGNRPVSAVIYSHSHADHYGGVLGVLSREEAARRKVPVLAPAGFLEAVVDENVIAGNAMGRRAVAMYGMFLPPGPRGQVDAGIGKNLSAGSEGLIAPTVFAERTGERITLDGVELVALLAPESEAPSEFMFWLPASRAFCAAEDALHGQHNLFTPRGAKYRSGLKWSKYLQQALDLWGGQMQVQFGSHHWPVWGNAECVAHLETQRDLYRAIHDQALRLANQGLSAREVAERIRLPEPLAREWSVRGIYGALPVNARAEVESYLGFYDGNPAHLNPLPPSAAAPRYVAAMGGAAWVMAQAQQAFAAGDYRWAAELLNHLLTAEPGHAEARQMLAGSYLQLAYQSESAPWRNIYLWGAAELVRGVPAFPPRAHSGAALAAWSLEQVLDWLGVRLNAERAGAARLAFNLDVAGERWAVGVQNGALHASAGRQAAGAPTLRCDRATCNALLAGEATPAALVAAGRLTVAGEVAVVERFLGLLDWFELRFPLVPARPG